jgi:hypothetical protein
VSVGGKVCGGEHRHAKCPMLPAAKAEKAAKAAVSGRPAAIFTLPGHDPGQAPTAMRVAAAPPSRRCPGGRSRPLGRVCAPVAPAVSAAWVRFPACTPPLVYSPGASWAASRSAQPPSPPHTGAAQQSAIYLWARCSAAAAEARSSKTNRHARRSFYNPDYARPGRKRPAASAFYKPPRERNTLD